MGRIAALGFWNRKWYHASGDAAVNLQEARGEAKPYQIRQFLRLVERHNLILEERE